MTAEAGAASSAIDSVGIAVAEPPVSLGGRAGSAAVGGGDRHRRQRRAVEADLVGLGRPVAVALLGPDVDDDRPLELERLLERREERLHVVARARRRCT